MTTASFAAYSGDAVRVRSIASRVLSSVATSATAVGPQRVPTPGAVHRAAVDMAVTELRRDGARHRSFSCAGGAVDGDHELFHWAGRAGRAGTAGRAGAAERAEPAA